MTESTLLSMLEYVKKEKINWLDELSLLHEQMNYGLPISTYSISECETNINSLSQLSKAIEQNCHSYKDMKYLYSIIGHYHAKISAILYMDFLKKINDESLRILQKNQNVIVNLSEIGDLCNLKVGDFVGEDILNFFENVLPPHYNTNLIQITEARDIVRGKNTYLTLWKSPYGWIYAGECYLNDGAVPFQPSPIYQRRSMEQRIKDSLFYDVPNGTVEKCEAEEFPFAEYVIETSGDKVQPVFYLKIVNEDYDNDNMCYRKAIHFFEHERGQWGFWNYLIKC